MWFWRKSQADGIMVTPWKRADFYWRKVDQPVYIRTCSSGRNFKGEIAVENRYSFDQFKPSAFKWKLVNFPSAKAKTAAYMVSANRNACSTPPKTRRKGSDKLGLPSSWSKNDALYLTAYADKKEIFTWSWSIISPAAIAKKKNCHSS